jgi:hypothetical protein
MGDIRLMKYVIAGKKDTYNKYVKNNNGKQGTSDGCFYLSNEKFVNRITKDDTIVLLKGWFAKKWAKQFIKDIKQLYPFLAFEYEDGVFGEKERNDLQSEGIKSRFEILDL